MDIKDKIRKRIKTMETAKQKDVNSIQITKEEFAELGDIKFLNGVKLIVVDKLGDKTKRDCRFYKNDECSALNELYCMNEECKFYKKTETEEN